MISDFRLVLGDPGPHGTHEDCGWAVLDAGLAQHGGCLCGQGFSLVPLAAGNRHQRPFGQRGRENIERAAISFLGLGVQPPTTNWGVMISETWRACCRATRCPPCTPGCAS